MTHKKPYKLAFFGTPQPAADLLEKIITQDLPIDIAAVVTQPDRPIGRKKIMTASPVKEMAAKYDIPVIDEPPQRTTHNIPDFDIGIMYFFGQILPESLIHKPGLGIWNIHFSALPKYRGAIPTSYALLMNEIETAISILVTDTKLDHGPIIQQQKVDILPQDTRIELEKRLHQTTVNMTLKLLQEKLASSNLTIDNLATSKQDHSQATYTKLASKQDGFIPFTAIKKAINNKPQDQSDFVPDLIKEFAQKNKLPIPNITSSQHIWNLYRALYGWPGIWTTVSIKDKETRLKITDTDYKNGVLSINKLQLAGKSEVSFEQFQDAYGLF